MKKVLALVLAVFIFGGSALAFAWWDQLTVEETIEISVGEGVTVTASITGAIGETEQLVPAGVVMKSGDVTSAVFTYEVSLNEPVLTDLDFKVVESNILLDGVAPTTTDVKDLIVIDISITDLDDNIVTTIDGNGILIIEITVTLTEPNTLAEYEEVANADITFDITFTAEQ